MAQTEAGKALQEDMLGRGGLMSVMMDGDVGECIRGAMGISPVAPVKPTGARAQAAKVAAQIAAKNTVKAGSTPQAAEAPSYQPHALAELFPSMFPSDYAELLADVQAHGVRDAIWIYEGKVLDGNHRLRAATEAGKGFETRQYTGHDPLGFVVSMNLRRRHLTTGQRASIADKMAQMGSKNGANLYSTSIAEAAAAMHVSPRAVKTVRAVAKASPELAAEVSNGTRTINSADQELKAEVRNGTKAVRNGTRNTEVGRELAAMTARVQEWIAQYGVDYLRHQYSAEFEKLVRVVVGSEESNSILNLNQDSFRNINKGEQMRPIVRPNLRIHPSDRKISVSVHLYETTVRELKEAGGDLKMTDVIRHCINNFLDGSRDKKDSTNATPTI